jgi:homoaconitase/3-isopropylmalate dehydratase large subunit
MSVPIDETYVSLEKQKILKRLLKSRGIKIDGDLEDLVIRMDMTLYAKQYIDAYKGFHSNKEITKEELKALKEVKK